MEWLSYLLVLVCPIMMIVCMRGHGGEHQHASHSTNGLDKKLNQLAKENQKLKKEIENLSTIVKKKS